MRHNCVVQMDAQILGISKWYVLSYKLGGHILFYQHETYSGYLQIGVDPSERDKAVGFLDNLRAPDALQKICAATSDVWGTSQGELCPVNPVDIGARTNAPMVKLADTGQVFWFAGHETLDFLEELRNGGVVVFDPLSSLRQEYKVQLGG